MFLYIEKYRANEKALVSIVNTLRILNVLVVFFCSLNNSKLQFST